VSRVEGRPAAFSAYVRFEGTDMFNVCGPASTRSGPSSPRFQNSGLSSRTNEVLRRLVRIVRATPHLHIVYDSRPVVSGEGQEDDRRAQAT
jgi:hypothetical protein